MATVDVRKILSEVHVDSQFQAPYDKVVKNGMKLMFSKDMEQQLNKQLDDKTKSLDERIASGVVAVMYMLWNMSGKALPPQIMVPATFTLTVQAFAFLQLSGDKDATNTLLGNAVEQSTAMILNGFGVHPEQVQAFVASNQDALKNAGANLDDTSAAPAPAAAPPDAVPPQAAAAPTPTTPPQGMLS